MDLGNSKLNPSSLIDLKAELHKKYDSFRKAKLVQGSTSSKPTPFKNKNDRAKEKKPKLIPLVKPKEENTEEELALKKSRLALEAKAKLYENIVSNKILIDDEQNDSYMVDFQRKVLYSSQEPEKVLKTDVSHSHHPISPGPTALPHENSYEEKYPFTQASSLGDTVEKTKAPNPDQPVHYQNVQHNEVRDHGTAYYAFSVDDEKRKEQLEELASMRQETEEQRLSKQRLQRKRKAMLQNRLAKICERKNIDQSVLQAFEKDTDSDVSQQQQPTDLSSIPLPEPKEESPKKEPKIRPWDIGKDRFQRFVPEKQKIKSQDEWVDEKRQERPNEFAPPTHSVTDETWLS